MNKCTVYIHTLAMAFILMSVMIQPQAGMYIDTGIDWLHNIPVKSQTDIQYEDDTVSISIEHKAEVNIDSPVLELGVGYRTKNNFHFEVHRFGVLTDRQRSITVFRFYRRWEFE